MSMERYATLLLLATTTLTLKDAADRGRLEGTTFIELNMIGALAFAQLSGESFCGVKNGILLLFIFVSQVVYCCCCACCQLFCTSLSVRQWE